MGRADRRVKVLGELVDLDEIERAIAQTALPDVWKIIDLPDPRRGCRLVLVSEAVPPSAAMRAALAAYQAHASGPTRLAGTAVVAAFPRGELGKLQMAQLRLLAEPQEAVKPWPDIQG
jgi:acyl-coenzyme A synthetase/AMP-(fatty) acid ligase